MDVSIILVNYNTKDLLRRCLQSLYQKTVGPTFEIIVSDNLSTDGSIKMLKEDFPDVVLIINEENFGFGKANNVAISVAKGKYLFLLNTDTYLINNAVQVLWAFMEKEGNNNVACCGADLFKPDGGKQASFGNFPSILDAVSQLGFYKLYKSYYRKHISSGVLNYDGDIKIVDYLCGADMFLRKSIMDKIGYFDEDFFLYFEETELSYRIKKSGFLSVLLPEAKIVHLEGGSQIESHFNFFKIREFSKSRRLYFEKSRGKFAAGIVKSIFIFQNILFFLLKQDSNYIKTAKIVRKA